MALLKRYFFIFICFCFSCIILGKTACADTIKVSQVRLGKQDEKTIRVVIHLTDKTPYRVFTLQNPSRVVIDFEKTTLDKSCSEKMPSAMGFIKQIRAAEPIQNQTRIVLEVTEVPEHSQGLFLAPTKDEKNWRFFVDLKATGTQKEPVKTPEEPEEPVAKPKETSVLQKKPLIVLDPGHGGTDPGAISISGKYEKNLTLKMALETQKALEKTGKYRVMLTRSTDKALALRDRIRFAHKYEADLFISIHADSARNKNAKGLSVYTISERASDKEAQMLAERENKADIILGIDLSNELPEVSNILIDLAKRDTMDKSAHYANLLVQKMAKKVTLVPNAHRFAGFVVLKSPSIPSVLIEIGYLSNPVEEKLLQKSDYRAKLSDSIVQAVNAYFDTIYY
ncbi:MAG: N-acetylmuramoyl-L-alanine amidase [Alphaproteobacteria bacterium]|nr:N-acetylmuramoyl-L-alanine amidase [Alphaproteobacteria bacterium]